MIFKKGDEGHGYGVTRVLGYQNAQKIGINYIPQVTEYEIKLEDRAIVIGSNELWEHLTVQDVTNTVNSYFRPHND